jgi:YVTN family beta-propeller protein
MKRASSKLFLSCVCLVLLLGMVLLGVQSQAQTFTYVTNDGSSSVSVINTASNAVTATVAVGIFPQGVAITPDGTRAYVTNDGTNSVSVIDTGTNTVVATVPVGIEPVGVAITPGIGPPTNKNQCKNDGWKVFTIPEKFKNQGDCVSFVNAGK